MPRASDVAARTYHKGASFGAYGFINPNTMGWMMYATSALLPSVRKIPMRRRPMSQATTKIAYTTNDNPAVKTRYEALPARWLMVQMFAGRTNVPFCLSGALINGGSTRNDRI